MTPYRRIAVRVVAVLCLLLAALPVAAAPLWAQGGTLYVCYPGNNQALSSEGCPCVSNNECRTVCSLATNTCGAVTGLPVCSAGNTVDASADGCPCVSNNECVGVCALATNTCGAVTNAQVCAIGNTINASAAGCPCTSNNECQSVCSVGTDTCGGVAGAVEPNLSTLAGIAGHQRLQLGSSTFDTATLSNGLLGPGGRIAFKLYPPSDAHCSGAHIFASEVDIAGNGTYTSGTFVPTQVGTYRWVATYRGDAYNVAVQTACGHSRQTFDVYVDLIFRNGFQGI